MAGVEIRRIVEADRAALLEFMRAMHSESPRFANIMFSEAKAAHLVGFLLSDPRAAAFIAVKDGEPLGMVGGLKVEYTFSTAKHVVDFGLYVAPEHRGGLTAVKLLKAFENWGWEDPEVHEFLMGISTGLWAERTGRLYAMLGYTPQGYTYRKTRGANVRT